MSLNLFNPFKDLIFEDQFCFLTGDLATEKMSVFPEWLMEHFNFGMDRIEMMDKSKSYNYSDLLLPCSPRVKNAFEELEKKIQKAYQKGFEGMKALEEELLFLWTGRMVYGMLYHEMRYESNRMLKFQENFNLSSSLRERFGFFHLMMQSIVEPISFVGQKPWSIAVFPLKYSADIFSYRDDTVNLLFQFGVNGFGFIACLQDNGSIGQNQKDILKKMEGHVLHPIQFEELFARFHYSDYILQYKPEFTIENHNNEITLEAIPISANENRPVFGFWDEEIFAQLLTNYWSVYGIQREDILQFQKPPLSFLEKPYTKDFIVPEEIDLPF
jgi:hypothetical protein